MSSFIRAAAKFIPTAIALVVETAQAVKAITARAPKKPRVFRPHHLWQSFDASSGWPTKSEVEFCFYCRCDRSRQNELDPCPGPKGWK